MIPDREAQIKQPIYLEEHRQHSDPPSIADGLIQSLEVIWIVTVDLHLNESNKQVGYLKVKFMTMDILMCCCFGGFLPPEGISSHSGCVRTHLMLHCSAPSGK